MKRTTILLLVSASITAAACGSKKDAAGSAASGGEAKPAEAAGPTKLPKLGLQLDAPGEITVGDAIGGEGHMLQGAGIGAMQIEVATKPETLDEAKAEAGDYSPKNVKGEAIADGWTLTYDNTGGAGANYFVVVRREIGGKAYKCSTTGSDPAQAAAVLAACKSLRK
jgi:hypothetical protein